jgi:uncharacterized protein (TIGR02117 family)
MKRSSGYHNSPEKKPGETPGPSLAQWMRSGPALTLAMFLFSGCLGPVQELYPDDIDQRTYEVYLLRHGWHVGIAFESAYFYDKIPDHDQIPQTGYLKFGWGDRSYYPAEDPGIGLLLQAALLPTRSVVHIVGFDINPELYFGGSDIIRIQVTEEGMSRMAQFISDRFRRDNQNEIIFLTDGLYSRSAFFEANGRYFIPKTSNTWAARALRKTGAPITPFYAVTSGNLIQQARKTGEVIRLR